VRQSDVIHPPGDVCLSLPRTMFFWTTAALITLAVLWGLLWPLLRRQSAQPDDSPDPLIAVYRDRRREIESERALGRLSAEEADAAVEELIQQMARELPEGSPPVHDDTRSQPSSLGARLVAVFMAVLMPAGAGLVYLQVGAPELTDPDTVAMLSAPPRFDAEQVGQLITQVEERVRTNPDDGEAWLVLASARKFQGNHAGAVEAFERALKLNPPGARMLAEFAESLALLAQGSFAGRPLKLLEQAMSLDPDDPKAVALMGAAQFQIGNLSAARTLMSRLLDAMPADQVEQRASMTEVIKRIDARIASEGQTAPASGTGTVPPQASGSPPLAAGPRASGLASATDAPLTGAGASSAITGSVRLSPELVAQSAGARILFITARAGSGPRIPYAAIRLESPQWPLEFRLDDSLAMDPSRRLSGAGEVVVEARLSKTGDALRRPGDLYGISAPVRPGAQDVRLIIDQVVTP
jgi:cytochrome c-type biogenesis protein CcmH